MNSTAKGICYALAACFFIALYSVFLKQASADGISAVWANFASYFAGAVILSFYVLPKGRSFFRTSHLPVHLARALCGVLASFLYALSMNYIPLVNANLFFNTAPLFIPILAIFMLGAKISARDWIGIGIGFIGVIIIIQPNAQIFHQTGDFIGLASGMVLGLAYIFVKMLTRTESPALITYNFFLFASLMQFPFVFFVAYPSWAGLANAAGSGVMAVAAQFFLAAAFGCADAAKVGALQYCSLIFVGIFSWLLWDKVPGWAEIGGMVLVIVGGVIVVLKSTSPPNPAVKPSTTEKPHGYHPSTS